MGLSEVAHKVFRLGTRWANFYLVVEGDEATLVDAGYPGYAKQVPRALESVGLKESAIAAIVVTHHHVDHAGSAARVRAATGARVLVGPGDAAIVRGERPSHVPPGFYRQSWRPSMLRYLAHSAVSGGATYRPTSEVELLEDGQVLDVPGRPRPVYTPGHTAGHVSVVLDELGVLFSGDALVNFDYATGRHALGQHRFNEDRERAWTSLDRLWDVDAETVLFGHGDPWRHGSRRALEIVRAGM
jgi:glyoxylase-like metal-dependent hydrolase (beta-lactamase superfamily II)